MKDKFIAVFVLLIGLVRSSTSLTCWKCIANDCDYDPQENYKATKESCDDGQQCMKVRYKMFDNVTYYDSVIRTCTAGPCRKTTPNEFQKCIATPKLYMISGCSLRSCCADRDLCNSGMKRKPTIYCDIILVMLALISWLFQ